jgi:ribosomal protein L29
MKKADYNKSLREKTDAQLQKELNDKQLELAKVRLERKANKLKDINLPSKLADDIARIKFELANRKAEAAKEAKAEIKEEVKEQE